MTSQYSLLHISNMLDAEMTKGHRHKLYFKEFICFGGTRMNMHEKRENLKIPSYPQTKCMQYRQQGNRRSKKRDWGVNTVFRKDTGPSAIFTTLKF